jgi:hypothetical protein
MSIFDLKRPKPTAARRDNKQGNKRRRPPQAAINPVLTNPAEAIDLLAKIFGCKDETETNSNVVSTVKTIKKEWYDFFMQLESLDFPHCSMLYKQAMELCNKLLNLEMVTSIFDKTVLGLGGQFSSGKSAFINAIAGLNDLLYVNQNPSTSIPAFVMKGPREEFLLSNTHGRDGIHVSRNQMQAISHDFHKQYDIGFSSFISSCIIQTPSYNLPDNIVLLDTPGYSKPDSEESTALSDRQLAMSHLRFADHLIWITTHENGDVSQYDIDFLEELSPATPVLFVVTHMDGIGATSRKRILSKIRETVLKMTIQCYGVTGYSSPDNKETDDANLIMRFIEEISLRKSDRKSDVNAIFEKLVTDINELLTSEIQAEIEKTAECREKIQNSSDVKSLMALSMMENYSSKRKEKLDIALAIFQEVTSSTQNAINYLIKAK